MKTPLLTGRRFFLREGNLSAHIQDGLLVTAIGLTLALILSIINQRRLRSTYVLIAELRDDGAGCIQPVRNILLPAAIPSI